MDFICNLVTKAVKVCTPQQFLYNYNFVTAENAEIYHSGSLSIQM